MDRYRAIEGFDELIRRPLEHGDPHSYRRIIAVLEKIPASHAAPFTLVLNRLVGRKLAPDEARGQWRLILALKQRMEKALGFTVDIQAAAVQHFSMTAAHQAPPAAAARPADAPAAALPAGRHSAPDSPDYWQVRLKDEIQRARRYNHALSAVLVDAAEPLAPQPRHRQEQDLALLGKVVGDTVRTVDILTPCAPFRFLVILPDTNFREASELAARVRSNVARRTARAHRTEQGLQVRLGTAQWEPALNAAAFTARLELSMAQDGADVPPPAHTA